MANPFKEAEKKAKVAPGGNKTEKTEEAVHKIVETAPPVASEEPVAPVAPVEQAPVAEQPKAEKKPAKSTNKIEALIGSVEKKQKPKKSTLPLYFSVENQEWLKKTAAARGISASELLDQILTQLRG